jgi:hypothetical protein
MVRHSGALTYRATPFRPPRFLPIERVLESACALPELVLVGLAEAGKLGPEEACYIRLGEVFPTLIDRPPRPPKPLAKLGDVLIEVVGLPEDLTRFRPVDLSLELGNDRDGRSFRFDGGIEGLQQFPSTPEITGIALAWIGWTTS